MRRPPAGRTARFCNSAKARFPGIGLPSVAKSAGFPARTPSSTAAIVAMAAPREWPTTAHHRHAPDWSHARKCGAAVGAPHSASKPCKGAKLNWRIRSSSVRLYFKKPLWHWTPSQGQPLGVPMGLSNKSLPKVSAPANSPPRLRDRKRTLCFQSSRLAVEPLNARTTPTPGSADGPAPQTWYKYATTWAPCPCSVEPWNCNSTASGSPDTRECSTVLCAGTAQFRLNANWQ
mmetsp:Transcript_95373/g.291659  ORF Transcript_95373/g.291659 Transcript_95373/m.291659 type:complete len:232 (+) Transcript_95373:751-1446(+)